MKKILLAAIIAVTSANTFASPPVTSANTFASPSETARKKPVCQPNGDRA